MLPFSSHVPAALLPGIRVRPGGEPGDPERGSGVHRGVSEGCGRQISGHDPSAAQMHVTQSFDGVVVGTKVQWRGSNWGLLNRAAR